MSIGVVETVAPEQHDIILGDFRAWYNYGLPTAMKIGATNGGCKVDIKRVIDMIKFDSGYGYYLDKDGVPLIRVREMTGIVTLEQLYLKYFNIKTISNCESDGAWENNDWSGTGGTYTAETSIKNSGEQSSKLTGNTDGYGIHEVFSSAKDLTLFNNAEVSGTCDKVGFAIYITSAELADLGSAGLRLILHMDSEGTLTNYYYTDIPYSNLVADEWKCFKIEKSAFSEQGTGDWSNVTGISFVLNGTPTAEVECFVDTIDLIQTHDYSAPLAINGGGFDLTNEGPGTYRKIKPRLEITDSDYIENITIEGQRHDGTNTLIMIKNCLNDGAISLALQEKSEVVNSTIFTGHYTRNKLIDVPIKIREYLPAA
ncbi:MAG: hypothetical protein EH224_10110 [Calditrichaeota bacterium]|nr:MAG: hypothetical protein EH224_10110 [Calditrichota bacterium]